ncbi:hypothetical protein Hypma_002184 [Hypsizygus marmoreus]|uniref:PWI domain-containing protein n=1 Tax=Hypsizygus marmoreus TaxID=39966 RepID=A0A369K7U6_HYPMA|nr:hypothetical protein Hypma_002184 [Hypsizygus marmoreus]
MADAGFFKGTSADQDRRFSDKELKLLKSMKFPPEFDKKVDMRKVNLNVIRPWIAKKIVELVGFEDEVVVEYAMGLLEDQQQLTPDPKKMQINLTGFLTKDTPAFMTALWNLLLEAQDDVTGVPRTFVEEKKAEMRRAREGDTRAIDERDQAGVEDVAGDGEEDMTMTEEEVGGHGTEVGETEVVALPVADHVDGLLGRPLPVAVLALQVPASVAHDHPHQCDGIALLLAVVHPPVASTAPALRLLPDAGHPLVVRLHAQFRGRRLLRGAGLAPLHSPLLLVEIPTSRTRLSPTTQRQPQPAKKCQSPKTPTQESLKVEVSYSSSPEKPQSSGSRSPPPKRESEKMDVDRSEGPRGSELKIKGQAEIERRKSKWDEEDAANDEPGRSKVELEKRENELKEKALRNKVMRTRKSSS